MHSRRMLQLSTHSLLMPGHECNLACRRQKGRSLLSGTSLKVSNTSNLRQAFGESKGIRYNIIKLSNTVAGPDLDASATSSASTIVPHTGLDAKAAIARHLESARILLAEHMTAMSSQVTCPYLACLTSFLSAVRNHIRIKPLDVCNVHYAGGK
jgi:hypothetical protein